MLGLNFFLAEKLSIHTFVYGVFKNLEGMNTKLYAPWLVGWRIVRRLIFNLSDLIYLPFFFLHKHVIFKVNFFLNYKVNLILGD